MAEEWIKINLTKYFESKNLLSANHHGGRKNFSTVTAKATLEHNLHKNFEDGLISGVLSTDLSSAFDTIDHKILSKKLKFYGVDNGELKLIESYLSNWSQFVEVDTFRSNLIKTLPCSCIQGSKLSGLLYTIYTNEIPLIQKIMKDPTFFKAITDHNLPKIKLPHHDTDNFVDDSNSVIGFEKNAKIRTYLEYYFKLLDAFYNSNLLKINPDKTQLMFVCKSNLKPIVKNLTFLAKGHIIKPKPSLKILGSYISHDLSNEREICNLIPILNNRINQFEKLKKYTNFHTRLQFSNSYIIGRLIYMMPTYTNLNKCQKDKLHKIIMRPGRTTLNSYCFKKSIEYILGQCNWFVINEMIKLSSLKFIHQVITPSNPPTLLKTEAK